MNHTKKALFVGPYPPPIDGHSFAFQTIYDNFKYEKYLINQNLKGKKFRTLEFLLIFWKYISFSFNTKITVLYIAGSRSVFGSLKDIILINAFSRRKVKIILHIHAANFDLFIHELNPILRPFFIKAYKRVDVFITLLDAMKKEYALFKDTSEIHTVENFYDKLLDTPHTNTKEDNKINLVYFSNLMYSKGVFVLLDAFKILCEKYDNIKLNIAGAYSSDVFMSEKDVQKKIEKYIDTNKNITYLGSVYDLKKQNLLLNSDISILPSFYSSEAFPISIIEAMKCGCAIITTNHHYLPNVVTEKNGICIEKQSVKQLCEAIEYFIQNKNILRDIQNFNMQYATDRYSPELYITKLTELIIK